MKRGKQANVTCGLVKNVMMTGIYASNTKTTSCTCYYPKRHLVPMSLQHSCSLLISSCFQAIAYIRVFRVLAVSRSVIDIQMCKFSASDVRTPCKLQSIISSMHFILHSIHSILEVFLYGPADACIHRGTTQYRYIRIKTNGLEGLYLTKMKKLYRIQSPFCCCCCSNE